jgi:hypothetical protein
MPIETFTISKALPRAQAKTTSSEANTVESPKPANKATVGSISAQLGESLNWRNACEGGRHTPRFSPLFIDHDTNLGISLVEQSCGFMEHESSGNGEFDFIRALILLFDEEAARSKEE